MKQRLKNFVDYQRNPVLLIAVYAYVMTDKVVRCLFIKDYKPKRLYF